MLPNVSQPQLLSRSLVPPLSTEPLNASRPNPLPDEVLMNIFGNLTGPELGVAQRVCRQWYKVGGDEHLWRENLNSELSIKHDPESIITAKSTYSNLFKKAMEARRPLQPQMPPAIPVSALSMPNQPPAYQPYLVMPLAAPIQIEAPAPRQRTGGWLEEHDKENSDWLHRRGPYKGLNSEAADRLHMERSRAVDARHGLATNKKVIDRMEKIGLENHQWFHKVGPYKGLRQAECDKLYTQRMKEIDPAPSKQKNLAEQKKKTSKKEDKIAKENHKYTHKLGRYENLSDKKAKELFKKRLKEIEKK